MRNFKGFQNFLSKGNYGPSKTNLFEVSIQPPRFVLANTGSPAGPLGVGARNFFIFNGAFVATYSV